MNIATGMQKVRRSVASFSLVALLLSSFVTVASAATYSDVPSDAWFYTYVEQLSAAGILDTTQAKYRPADLANRAEAAKLLVEAANLTIDTSAGPSFKDVATGAWYYQYVETAAKNGIVSGYKDAAGNLTGNFGPGNNVTREEFSKMAVNAMALSKMTDGGPHFGDVPTSRWSYEFVETLYNNSVVDGYPDGTFKPGNAINRAEIAKFVVGAMNPVKRGSTGAFNVQQANATSATMLDVLFNQDVETTSGAISTNYKIADADGSPLAVTAATVSADKVTLTTASQTANRPYTLTVTGVKSMSGKDLASGNNTVNFNGYNPLGTGGPLSVSLSATSPASMSAPKGASGVVFSCFDFTAGADAVVVQSLMAHRVGAGSEQDFSNVYLYNGAQRLTTGRTINSETQMVQFNNINVSIPSGGVAKLCVVGDLAVGAGAAGQHTFELKDATAITTNASSVSGTFPEKGNFMSVAGGTVGTVTVRANGSLDELTIGQQGARIAQFELEANGSEDEELQRIAPYIRGSIRPTDLSNLKLYAEGSTEVLATADTVANNSIATFSLAKPYVVGRGQRKIFYITADVRGRNGDTIKTYLDESTDLLMVGKTFGFGVQVANATTSSNSGYDGATTGSNTGFSQVTLKGSTFTVAFNGPTARDLAVGQKAAHCMDLTITNASDSSVELKNWQVNLAVQNVPTSGGTNGLINGTTTPNFSLIKLARVNDDGSLGGSLLGPSELSTTGSDQTQTIVLSGSGTVNAGETIHAAVVLDVATTAQDGDKLKCTLIDLTSISDAVRDANGDALTATSITPATNITGNIMTVSASALTFNIASTPSTRTYVRGATDVDLVGLTVRAGSSLDNTIKNLNIQGYVDGTGTGTFSTTTSNGVALKDIVDSVALYNGSTMVSQVKNVNAADNKIVFNNLNIVVPKSQTLTLTLRGHINNSAPYVATTNRVKFAVAAQTDVTAIDQNGQTVNAASILVTGAANGGTATTGTIMTISNGGSGTVSNSSGTESKSRLLAGGEEQVVGRFKFDATNEDLMLKDLTFGTYDASATSISRVKFYNTAGTQVGDPSGYPVESNGTVLVKDMNLIVPDPTPTTIEARAVVNNVGPGAGVSGTNVGLTLLSVDEVSSSAGANIANSVAGTPTSITTTSALTSVAPLTTVTGVTFSTNPTVGSVILIENEPVYVASLNSGSFTIVRGVGLFPNTTSTGTHASGSPVYTSTLALRAFTGVTPVTASAQADTTTTVLTVSSATSTIKAGDVLFLADGATLGDGARPEYELVTDVNGATLTVVRGLYGSSPSAHPASENIVRFVNHGEVSRLRKTKPALSLDAIPSNTTLPNQATTVLRFTIAATGADQVIFDAGNSISVSMNALSRGTIAGPLTCFLRDASNSSVVYSPITNVGSGNTVSSDWTAGNGTAGLVAGAAETDIITFAGFGTSGFQNLVINGGSSVKLEVVCDTSGMSTSGGGDKSTLSANILRAAGNVVYDDGLEATNISGDELLMSGLPLNGVTITN